MTPDDELWDLVRSVPKGRITTYGALGAALKNPATGFLVGRMMARCPEGLPWWRVVAKTGSLPVAKLDPFAGIDQRRLLEKEGVRFLEDRVDVQGYLWEPL
jgi:methylated-DNA-protein-cysteine methyltransferase-like protein